MVRYARIARYSPRTDCQTHPFALSKKLQVFVSKGIFVFILFLFHSSSAEFKFGIENMPEKFISYYVDNKISIGLITNQTGKDQRGNRTLDLLLKKGFKVSAVFAPEHGIEGKIELERDIKDGLDKKTGIPVISLYKNGTGKKIDPDMIKHIDAFFFDIQDSGMRHYTYISTLFMLLQSAGQENKRVVVFDRPNPLGKTMEGPLVDPALISFISIASIPLRHGMTVGEFAEYFNNHVLEKRAGLTVIPMKEYDRAYGLADLHAPLLLILQVKHPAMGIVF